MHEHPKDEVCSGKNEKNLAKILLNAKIHEIYKENFVGGEQILKQPSFGLRCANFAQICFYKRQVRSIFAIKKEKEQSRAPQKRRLDRVK